METSVIDWGFTSSVAPAPTNSTQWTFDDPIQRKVVGAMLIVIGLSGLVGNAIVIIAFTLSERLQNITNVFVINLAVSDFLSSALVPFFLQNVLADDLLPETVCAMVGIMLYVFVSSSIVNHAVIAVNRYCSISRPVPVYRKLFSPIRIVFLLVFIWVYSSIIPFVTHFTDITKFGKNTKYRICSLDVITLNALIVSIVRSVAVDMVCFIIVVIFYFKIFLFIKRHSKELMHVYSTERRTSEISHSSPRGSQVAQFSRQASTLTRVVNVDDVGVETVLSEPRRPVEWRHVARSVSDSNMEVVSEACNGSFEGEGEIEEGSKVVDEGNFEGRCVKARTSSNASENFPRKREPTLSAITETAELKNTQQPGNNVTDDVTYSGSSESTGSRSPEPAIDAERNNNNSSLVNGRYRSERNSSSTSPNHSPFANRRRRLSNLVHRSFFGRNSSVSSTSERIRCMQVRLNRRQIQITKNLFVVVCAFVICITQYAVFLIVPSFERLLPYSAVMITLSHAINPLIYAIKHPTFKVVIRPMIMCKFSKIPGPSKVLKFLLRR